MSRVDDNVAGGPATCASSAVACIFYPGSDSRTAVEAQDPHYVSFCSDRLSSYTSLLEEETLKQREHQAKERESDDQSTLL